MMMNTTRFLLATTAAFALGACSFGEKVPATLMSITADAQLQPGPARPARAGETVQIMPPSVPTALATQRVPVTTGPTAVAYLKGAMWAEPPQRLFRQLLVETVGARTGRVVLDLRQFTPAPGIRLGGRLQNFGLDAASGGVIVRYDATLTRGDAAESRRFEARVPVSSEDAQSVAIALNQAANRVAGEVADWIGQ